MIIWGVWTVEAKTLQQEVANPSELTLLLHILGNYRIFLSNLL